jgi:hypothetical protein
MSVSPGYGVRDVIDIGSLAWNIYKSCKAPERFAEISLEVQSLHAVLKEMEEVISAQSLPPEKQEELKAAGDGCRCILEKLQQLVKEYESLGTRRIRIQDRMKFGAEDISALRSCLVSHTSLLNSLLTVLTRSVQVFRMHIVLPDRLVVYLKPMLRRNLTNLGESFGKGNDMARLYLTTQLTLFPLTRKKSGVLFARNSTISV